MHQLAGPHFAELSANSKPQFEVRMRWLEWFALANGLVPKDVEDVSMV